MSSFVYIEDPIINVFLYIMILVKNSTFILPKRISHEITLYF